jgi:glutathionylspermidine synthase
MQRIAIAPRPHWQAAVAARGLTWHTAEDGTAYWDESAYWRFDPQEIDRIEAATDELYAMVLDAVGHVVETGRIGEFGYDGAAGELIARSWARRDWEPTLYARFDLAYDGRELKLLELNGDTPTSLVEAAVVQWWWLEDRFPGLDQFNSIHERVTEAFRLLGSSGLLPRGTPVHFTSVAPHPEDEGTVGYLAACAAEAGLATAYVALGDIGLRRRSADDGFTDLADRRIATLFKLAPWEWLLADPFGPPLAEAVEAGRIRLIEPAWKMLASNKRLLVTLKQLFPQSPYLLDASEDEAVARRWGEYVRKPLLGREGANVSIFGSGGPLAENAGGYAGDRVVYQRRARLMQADARYAVLGSWVVNRQACGLGVRESTSPITSNLARFVPHVIGG